MTKKTEDSKSILNTGRYYIEKDFAKFAQPAYLQKRKAREAVSAKFKAQFFYNEPFTEIWSSENHRSVDERVSWYEAIENGKLKPSVDENGNVRLLADRLSNRQHVEWCEPIEVIAAQWIERVYCKKSEVKDETRIDLIMQSLTQLARYLPELQKQQPNYFLDMDTYKVGVTMQGEGTLTLLIGRNSEIEYSYAQRQERVWYEYPELPNLRPILEIQKTYGSFWIFKE